MRSENSTRTMTSTIRGSALSNTLLTLLLLLSRYSVSADGSSSGSSSGDDSFFKESSGASANDPSNPNTPDPNQEGAEGPSKSGINLSKGSIIAISVVVGCIAIIAIASAVLFYVAKKRQWEVRKSIRRSAKRVTTTIKAHTPVRANFSRRDRGVTRIDPPTSKGRHADDSDRRAARIYRDANRDLEKGSVSTKTRPVDGSPGRKANHESQRATAGHGSTTHIESARASTEKDQGSWAKKFGRRT